MDITVTMNNRLEFPDRFTRDIAEHQMEVIRDDDDCARHLRFKRPGTYNMGFDIITWPGHLCYTGDMGTYVFARVRDMMTFFRANPTGDPYRIDFRYWAEKVLASDKSDGLTEFCEEKFKSVIKGDLMQWTQDHRNSTTKEERRDLWEAVDDILSTDDSDSGERRKAAAYDFSHRVNGSLTFSFSELWEHDFDQFTHRFLWCCHALEWAVRTYDAAKLEGIAAG